MIWDWIIDLLILRHLWWIPVVVNSCVVYYALITSFIKISMLSVRGLWIVKTHILQSHRHASLMATSNTISTYYCIVSLFLGSSSRRQSGTKWLELSARTRWLLLLMTNLHHSFHNSLVNLISYLTLQILNQFSCIISFWVFDECI